MAGSIKGIIVEIGGDTSGLQKALSKVNSATSSLSRELRGINSLLKLDPKNTDLLSQRQVVLNKEIGKTEEKLKTLKQIQEEADKTLAEGGEISQKNYRALQREIINTENKLKKLKLECSNWTQAGRRIEEIGTKIQSVGNRVDSLGNKLTKMFTTSVVGIGTVAVKSAMDFETAFTGVEKTVDGTKEQMEQLKQGIKDLTKEVPSTATEISAVAEAAGQLGIQTDNILDFSKAMIDLGNSTNLTAEDAATQLARFANIMQMPQKDFGKLGSSIVDLGNNFATTEAEIVSMAMRLAGAGKQVGFSEGQVMGLATALSSVGVEAEMGGSAISKAMVKMQNAVEMGGNKLNPVLQKTGFTLRELELMSANDSKEFKALSQSIGMTSTEVKQLITAGTNLEDFAKISGMSAKQFQKAWKEDASGALTSFIKGLGDAETKGESAITMLSEMGLTEVRLRDSLLRAANAGTLLNDAIETGTKAFEDNTALTKEANKRYATLESRFKTTLNKTNNLAINFGKKLTPSINKLLDKADKFIDKLDSLSEEETENVVKIGLMVASTGPLIKIIGKVISVTGSATKGIGIFSQAIGVLKTGAESSDKAVNTLAKGIGALTSPAGLATLAITATAGAFAYLYTKQTESQKKAQEFAKEVSNEKKSLEEYIQSIDKTTESNVAHINSVGKLKDELRKLVDENGKVKKGYEGRVSFILNELNEALGTEYQLNGNIIDKYKDLQKEIDKTIEKKKAEILLSANEEKYKDAIEKQTDSVETMKKAYEQLSEYQNEYCTDIDGLKRKVEELNKTYTDMLATPGIASIFKAEKFKKEAEEIQNVVNAYQDAENNVKIYTDNIKQYETNYALFAEGKYNEISKTIIGTTKKWTDGSIQEIRNGIEEQSKQLDTYKEMYKKVDNDVIEEQEKQAKKSLENLAQELANRTSTIESLGEDEKEAWRTLAQKAYDEYSREVSKMSPKMQEEIQAITGVAIKDTSVKEATKGLAKDAKEGFNDNVDGKKWGNDLTEEMASGMKNKRSESAIVGAANTVAGWIKSILGFSIPEKGPLHNFDKSMPDMIDLMNKGINDNRYRIIASAEKLAKDLNDKLKLNTDLSLRGFESSKINSKIIDSTKTVFTTPNIIFNVQELDEAKLQQCFNYINRKFGSAY